MRLDFRYLFIISCALLVVFCVGALGNKQRRKQSLSDRLNPKLKAPPTQQESPPPTAFPGVQAAQIINVIDDSDDFEPYDGSGYHPILSAHYDKNPSEELNAAMKENPEDPLLEELDENLPLESEDDDDDDEVDDSTLDTLSPPDHLPDSSLDNDRPAVNVQNDAIDPQPTQKPASLPESEKPPVLEKVSEQIVPQKKPEPPVSEKKVGPAESTDNVLDSSLRSTSDGLPSITPQKDLPSKVLPEISNVPLDTATPSIKPHIYDKAHDESQAVAEEESIKSAEHNDVKQSAASDVTSRDEINKGDNKDPVSNSDIAIENEQPTTSVSPSIDEATNPSSHDPAVTESIPTEVEPENPEGTPAVELSLDTAVNVEEAGKEEPAAILEDTTQLDSDKLQSYGDATTTKSEQLPQESVAPESEPKLEVSDRTADTVTTKSPEVDKLSINTEEQNVDKIENEAIPPVSSPPPLEDSVLESNPDTHEEGLQIDYTLIGVTISCVLLVMFVQIGKIMLQSKSKVKQALPNGSHAVDKAQQEMKSLRESLDSVKSKFGLDQHSNLQDYAKKVEASNLKLSKRLEQQAKLAPYKEAINNIKEKLGDDLTAKIAERKVYLQNLKIRRSLKERNTELKQKVKLAKCQQLLMIKNFVKLEDLFDLMRHIENNEISENLRETTFELQVQHDLYKEWLEEFPKFEKKFKEEYDCLTVTIAQEKQKDSIIEKEISKLREQCNQLELDDPVDDLKRKVAAKTAETDKYYKDYINNYYWLHT